MIIPDDCLMTGLMIIPNDFLLPNLTLKSAELLHDK